MTTKGATIAAMAAGMFLAMAPTAGSAKATAKVHCEGVNSCKGKGACASAEHSCSGQNTCKGKGWIETTAKKCKAKGGHVAAEAGMDKAGMEKK
jgi:hypothetical protein